MQITIPCHILVNSDAALKYGTPFAYVCADVYPFFLVGNTCCYMALLWKLQIN